VTTFEQSPARLVAVGELGASQVVVVEKTPHGALAVGISAGKPFAVSNRCRHLFASLGKGHVTDDGCLQCPWHAALYDVGTGAMVRGPQGVQAAGGRCEGDDRRPSAEDIPGRGARRRDLVGWLSDGPTRSASRRGPRSRITSTGV
jgi:nitrite reductase/ring-hydroxylating ferredoxin subunit